MFSSYKSDDVIILLKDITGMVTPLGTKEREQFIQSGVHYSEMLPIEYVPSESYLDMFFKAMKLYSKMTAEAVASVAKNMRRKDGRSCVSFTCACRYSCRNPY